MGLKTLAKNTAKRAAIEIVDEEKKDN